MTSIDGACGDAIDLALSPTGEVYVVGGDPVDCQESWTAKLDPAGGLLWEERHPSPDGSVAISVVALDDGCAVAGTDLDPAYLDAGMGWLERRDASGTLRWGEDVASEQSAPVYLLALDADDEGLVVAGNLSSDEGSDIVVQRYTLTGELDWTLVYGDEASLEALKGMSVAHHGVYVTAVIEGESVLVRLR